MKVKIFPVVFVFFSFFFINSCGDNSVELPEPEGRISITANTDSFESGRGTSVAIPMTLKAEEGLQSLTVSIDGQPGENISTSMGQTSLSHTYTYTIPANALLGSSAELEFTATDVIEQSAKTKVVVSTGKLIDSPATYSFTRNGETTVSYTGQNERLDMLEIIKKEILLKGDQGEVISEQALLAAFNNAEGNGGGLFLFETTKQLGNKTFQPDLDDRLFENLFASAAQASEAGSGGQMASNGIAGLITRESKGSTVLIDANGREFTQLIEKGLMGAVFYHQTFNTYFSDARTGDDVENTELRAGKNYNDMEHHWDEAFGYWNPPIDFSSEWPSDRADEDRFWSHYSNTVDPHLGTNSIIMQGFIEGRTAIVNNDLDTKNVKRTEVAENLELVAAAVAVHYINAAQEALNKGNIGDTFHVLSEVWAFVNALKYYPNRKISLNAIEEIKEQDLGAEGNFWNVTPEGLTKAKATLVTAYPQLAPVQDEL